MTARYLSSATAGAVVTAALLWTMHALIEWSEVITDPSSRGPALNFVRVPEPELPPQTVDPRPQPIEAPLRPPRREPQSRQESGETPFLVPARPAPPPTRQTGGQLNNPDTGLVSIIQVQPEYPVAASTSGLEGYVDVQFDVTTAGTVANPIVVASSDRVFEKAAIKAALRARYRPLTVDGQPQPSFGLQKRFRFELEPTH